MFGVNCVHAFAANKEKGQTDLRKRTECFHKQFPSLPSVKSFVEAVKNSAEAQYQLGLMFAEGVGGDKDDVAARALFEKAAAQDHPGALERMGAFAQSGRGGPQDTSAAKAYYEKAASLGNEDAKAALKRLQCRYAIKDKRGNVVTELCF